MNSVDQLSMPESKSESKYISSSPDAEAAVQQRELSGTVVGTEFQVSFLPRIPSL